MPNEIELLQSKRSINPNKLEKGKKEDIGCVKELKNLMPLITLNILILYSLKETVLSSADCVVSFSIPCNILYFLTIMFTKWILFCLLGPL